MSPRDVPLWVRGVAAVLLWFATWWLLATEALRRVLGDSIGILSLGVVAVFILRGMQLPAGIWPDGPWRRRFSIPALFGPVIALAALVVIVSPASSEALGSRLDPGYAVAIVVGAVVWGFSIAQVRQRSYLPWYVIAIVLALLPHVVALPLLDGARDGNSGLLCLLSTGGPGDRPTESAACRAAVVPAFTYLFIIGIATKLVTEEIAFRRLMIGRPDRAGAVLVLGSAAVALVWHLVVANALGLGVRDAWILGMGAVCAGSLYVLARSLLVSAAYGAAFAAAQSALWLARPSMAGAESAGAPVGAPATLTAAVIAVGLVLFVVRRNGWMGGLRRTEVDDATRG